MSRRLSPRFLFIVFLFGFLILYLFFLRADINTFKNTKQQIPNYQNFFPNEEVTDYIEDSVEVTEKNWFFVNGTKQPTLVKPSQRCIFPEEDPNNDRIVNQLMYIPISYNKNNVKKILVINGIGAWNVKDGNNVFQECPVNACSLTFNIEESKHSDTIIFRDTYVDPGYRRKDVPNQIWILYILESPHHSPQIYEKSVFNWTATYRLDSDIVAPYEKWVYYNSNVKQKPLDEMKNYAMNKTKKVAWLVSNCHSKNGRYEYALELAKYIQVDIYGHCGSLQCTRGTKCFHMLETDYKFYLSFENSNCRNYITEKFYQNGLRYDILPIAMGAPKEDYLKVAPKNSFIHVDDFDSPKHLAQFLHQLDKDDSLYNTYFQWKNTGEFINTYFWCRVCSMIHDTSIKPKHYEDINQWWRTDVCI